MCLQFTLRNIKVTIFISTELFNSSTIERIDTSSFLHHFLEKFIIFSILNITICKTLSTISSISFMTNIPLMKSFNNKLCISFSF
uniref:Uncharacterized protein n=1 Tax=Arundo donax TaxID=35708 RepID=A0A0A9E6R1_ARUDO